MLDKLADLVIDHLVDLKGRGIDPRRAATGHKGVDTTMPTKKSTMDCEAEDER